MGSTTASAADTATAASKALPPWASICMPARLASGWLLAMAARPGTRETLAESTTLSALAPGMTGSRAKAMVVSRRTVNKTGRHLAWRRVTVFMAGLLHVVSRMQKRQ